MLRQFIEIFPPMEVQVGMPMLLFKSELPQVTGSSMMAHTTEKSDYTRGIKQRK